MVKVGTISRKGQRLLRS